MEARARALEHAREAGFDLAGVAPLAPPPDAERFEAWLDAGHHAGLDYMERYRERILDPRRVQPTGRSILVVGLAHSRAEIRLEGGARVARYAAGRDYHKIVGKRLVRLREALRRDGLIGEDDPARKIVDAGPLLERSHAAAAGIGFPSKAANLLHPRFGPWFFLGELILDAELEPTTEPPPGSCGTCTACLDACPTDAILEPGRVDAGLCLSYHTIESRGTVPEAVRRRTGPWAFGCDVCSEVCPWGTDAPDLAERFGTHPVLEAGPTAWLGWRQEAEWRAEMAGSPLQRPGRAGLARNAAIVLAHHPSDPGRAALLEALTFDPEPLVRGTAGWALGAAHGADAGVRQALERARTSEADPSARAELEAALEGPVAADED